MKTWQVLLLVGGVAIVGVVLLMNAQRPKATTANASFPTGNSAINGLAAGIGGFLGQYLNKNGSASGPINATSGASATGGISAFPVFDSSTGDYQDKWVMPMDRDYT